MKVYALAKELGKSPKELVRFLADVDIKVKSPNTKLDPPVVEEIRGLFKGETPEDLAKETRMVDYSESTIVVQDLAKISGAPLGDLMKAILQRGMLLNLNSEMDITVAKEIAEEFNVIINTPSEGDIAESSVKTAKTQIEEEDILDDSDSLTVRPPVITIMGHVDHGKTLLLDTIRKSNVISGEAGGITQHIGAYQVTVNDQKLTFLDTPGHEAFTTLRARGAQITDIVILVVAADEGLKPQTIEAIDHAKAADVPIIVAINKIDKPNSNIDNVKQQLSQHDLLSEDWGGSTIMVPLSAKTGDGIDQLLDMLNLLSETLELKANPKRSAKGIIIEAHLSRHKGPLCTVLVKSGTLRVGDHFLIETGYGKVRAMNDDKGDAVQFAEPGCPVEVLGVSDVPPPGAILEVFNREKDAKEEGQQRRLAARENSTPQKGVSLEALSQQAAEGDLNSLNIILKTDVHGSAEAISALISGVDSGDVSVSIIHAATGQVNENDIMLAAASNAIIIAFQVDVRTDAAKLAESERVEVKAYSIIYEIAEDIKKTLSGFFTPEFEEVEVGRLEVRQLFKSSKVGSIAGSYVLSGKLVRNAVARVFRSEKEIYHGKIASLKRFKDDVKEVEKGFECGVVLDAFQDLQESDIVVAYELQEKR